jgi:cytochrome c oxidase subunit IV
MASEEGQQHPLSVYFWIWGLLFVLSFFSYMVDYMNFQGNLRWGLILMHMKWERPALKLAILGPPVAILVLIWLMALEGEYIEETRFEVYGESELEVETPHH